MSKILVQDLLIIFSFTFHKPNSKVQIEPLFENLTFISRLAFLGGRSQRLLGRGFGGKFEFPRNFGHPSYANVNFMTTTPTLTTQFSPAACAQY